MPVTITDVNDYILLAKAKQQEIMKEAVSEYYQPMQKVTMAMQLKNMPPEVLAELEKKNPTAMKALKDKLKIGE